MYRMYDIMRRERESERSRLFLDDQIQDQIQVQIQDRQVGLVGSWKRVKRMRVERALAMDQNGNG